MKNAIHCVVQVLKYKQCISVVKLRIQLTPTFFFYLFFFCLFVFGHQYKGMFASLHTTFSFNLCPINKPPKIAGFLAYRSSTGLPYFLLQANLKFIGLFCRLVDELFNAAYSTNKINTF